MAAPAIVAKLGLDAGDFKKGIADAKKEASAFSDALSGAVAGLGAGLGVAGLVEFGKASIMAAAKVETLQTSFEVMTGSAETASTLMGDIMDAAASTPLETSELAGAAKSLLAFNTSAKDVVPTMMKLGDIASGIGAPVGEIAEIYGKARVQGRLFAEDVNQLTGRGIPVIQEFAKQFGVTDNKVKDLVESGKIGFEQLETAINSLTGEGGKFHGMMQKQSETTAGKISTMKDAFEGLERAAGKAMVKIGGFDAITKALNGAASVTDAIFGNGVGMGDDTEKTFAQRLNQFFNPHSGGLNTTQGRKEFEEAKARQKALLEARAAEEEKARQDASAKKKAEEEEDLKDFNQLAQDLYNKRLEEEYKARQKAAEDNKKLIEDVNKFEAEKFAELLKKKAEADRKAVEDEKRKQDRKDEIAQNAKDLEKQEAEKFISDELAGPDARRQAKRDERERARARAKFGRMRDLKNRKGHAKEDMDDPFAPFKDRGGAEAGMGDAGKPKADDKNAIAFAQEAQQFLTNLVTKLSFVMIK